MSRVVSLSEAASIGIHGIILIAKSGEPVNVIRISDLTGTSKHHVAKIMQRLAKERFITSQRGPNGGFTMSRDPGKITFLDIFEAIEGKLDMPDCPMDKPVCPFDKCIMNNVMNRLSSEFHDYLSKQKVSDYI